MSPTLENLVRIPFLLHHLDIRSRIVVPEGLQVGGETDHTVLLEVAAEGILSTESACYPAILYILRILPSVHRISRESANRRATTYPGAGAQTVRVRHGGGVGGWWC